MNPADLVLNALILLLLAFTIGRFMGPSDTQVEQRTANQVERIGKTSVITKD